MSPESPISEAKLAANRANAAKSTGPTSEAGKAKSRVNALKHGLTGTVTIMTPEERETRDLFVSQYVHHLKPEGPVETEHAEAAAEQAYRMKRARSLDQNIFSLGHPALHDQPGEHEHPEIAGAISQARAWLNNNIEFQRLTLYEQRIQRSMSQSLEALEQLQTKRKAERAEALELATGLARLNHAKGLHYNPDKDFPGTGGFVFSTEEINDAINLNDRKTDVAWHQKNGWDASTERRSKKPAVIKEAIALPQAA